jgi:hypothetical protein
MREVHEQDGDDADTRADSRPDAAAGNGDDPRVHPREGAEVKRYFRRTRWTDGSTVTWLAHRGGLGLGPGWSGLAFDLVRPLGSQQ